MADKTSTGRYRLRLVYLPRVLLAAGANNEQAETWPDPPADPVQEYFAARDSLSGGEQIAQGLRQEIGGMRLRIKGRSLPITAADRVKVKVTGELFNVVGVEREYAETVITVERVQQQVTSQ